MAFFLRQKRKGSNPVKGAPCRSGWRVGLLHIHILDFPRGRFGRGGVLVGEAHVGLALHGSGHAHRNVHPTPTGGAPSGHFHLCPSGCGGCAAGVVGAEVQRHGGFVHVNHILRADGVLEVQRYIVRAGQVDGRGDEPAFGLVGCTTDVGTCGHVVV